jgi:CheY-like chemotaxis protein
LTYIDRQVTFALSPLIRGISLARKILLADDSVTAQNMGRKILADAGYEVIAVNNGSAALKKIAELKPDLVILDVYMPGYSGLEVCQRLKESQETARIPVLLSVGKLEPFKPEESQRVRADGYIVKPFEASELLSALSKLEDKVVPRAEPSKPGRFARAIAAAEESGRGNRNEPSSAESGWKSRIGFPKQKAEPEEKVADEAPIYNPVNRDLRTVVEKPIAEMVVEKDQTQQPEAAKTSVDVAALAPSGLPKDVTPEEVAAIAAAAAQMQMVASALQDEPRVSDRVGDSVSSPQDVQSGSAAPVNAEALAQSGEESKIASIAGETAAHETGDAPVTMASTAETVVAAGTSRWTAVPVALEGEEAAISLDQEMQKAHAAFAAADSAGVVGAPEAAIVENSSGAEAAVETPVAISNPDPEAVQNPEHAVSGDAVVAETATGPTEVASPSSEPSESTSLPEAIDASSPEPEAAVLTPASVEVAQVETSPAAESAEPRQEPVPEPAPVAEFVSPVVEREVADAAGQAAPALETQPAPEAEPAMAEHRLDPETVKSTAAAWASWRQNRDTGKDDNAAEVQSRETAFDAPEPAPTEATARAVAAGAEQTMQEAAAAASPESDNRTDVASIVDSVLADLRPKLMKEISRKMSEKK